MHFDEIAHERESNAHAAFGVGDGAARLSEKIEDRGRIRPKCYAIIANADDGLAAVARHRYLNAALRRRVFCGVVEKIGEHLRQRTGSPSTTSRSSPSDTSFRARSLQQGVAGLDRLMDDGGKVEMLFPELDLPARDARDLKQIVDEANEMIHLPLHHRQQRTARSFPPGCRRRFSSGRKQHCGWARAIAQLMGEASPEIRPCDGRLAKRPLGLPAS